MTLIKLVASNHGMFRVVGIMWILLANHTTTARPLRNRQRDLEVESSSREYTFKTPPYPKVVTESAKLYADSQDEKSFWSVYLEREVAGSYGGLLSAKPTDPPAIFNLPSTVPTSEPSLEPMPTEKPSNFQATPFPTFGNTLLPEPSLTLTKPPTLPPTREPTVGPTMLPTSEETATSPTSPEPGSFLEPSAFQPSILPTTTPTTIPTGSTTQMPPSDAAAIATDSPTQDISPTPIPTGNVAPYSSQELDSETNGVNEPTSQTETGKSTNDPMTQPDSEPTLLVTDMSPKPTTMKPTLLPTIELTTGEPSLVPTRLSTNTYLGSLPTATLISSSEPTTNAPGPKPSSDPAVSVATTSELTTLPMITQMAQQSETGPTTGPFQASGHTFNETSLWPSEAPGDVPSGGPMAPPSLGQTPCEVVTALSCTTLDSRDCNELRGEQFIQCRCEDDCPRELVYRYTAAPCDPSFFPRNCADFEANGAVVEVIITDLNEEDTFFEGRIQIDDDIVLAREGGCLPSSFQVNVISPNTGDISQIVTLDSFCGVDGPTLLDDYGAFRFAGYTCRDDIQHNCYIEVEYDSNTAWSGTANQTLSRWNFVLNGLESSGSTTFPPLTEQDQSYSTIIPQEVYLCADGDYTASVSVSAVGQKGGKQCGEKSDLTFTITVGLPFPTPSPGGTPNASPSSSSDYPSDDPTEVPMALPSIETSSETALPSLPAAYAATKGPTGQTWPTSAEILGQTEIPSAVEGSRAPITGQTSQPTFLKDLSGNPLVVTASPTSSPFSPSVVPSFMPTNATESIDIPSFQPSGHPSPVPSGYPLDVLSLTPGDSILDGPSDLPSGTPSVTPSPGSSDACMIEVSQLHVRYQPALEYREP
jgi:hypothetical protein